MRGERDHTPAAVAAVWADSVSTEALSLAFNNLMFQQAGALQLQPTVSAAGASSEEGVRRFVARRHGQHSNRIPSNASLTSVFTRAGLRLPCG